jgi:cysteinyl-tRNA synthetase
MYHCGPTVKEHLNVAKFRSYLLADLLRRYFEVAGFDVLQVMNITDVGHLNVFEEDAVEIAAARTGFRRRNSSSSRRKYSTTTAKRSTSVTRRAIPRAASTLTRWWA